MFTSLNVVAVPQRSEPAMNASRFSSYHQLVLCYPLALYTGPLSPIGPGFNFSSWPLLALIPARALS